MTDGHFKNEHDQNPNQSSQSSHLAGSCSAEPKNTLMLLHSKQLSQTGSPKVQKQQSQPITQFGHLSYLTIYY